MARVLVVDEDVDVREALRLLLEDAGYLVLEAADAAAGVALLRTCRDGLVVLFDERGAGPRGDSLFVAASAEASLLKRHAYVCLTTSVTRLEPALHILFIAWSVPVLPKPFDLDVLLGTVSEAESRLVAAHTDPSSTSPVTRPGLGTRRPTPVAASHPYGRAG
jgi:DNA-binding NtrC family response regulator